LLKCSSLTFAMCGDDSERTLGTGAVRTRSGDEESASKDSDRARTDLFLALSYHRPARI